MNRGISSLLAAVVPLSALPRALASLMGAALLFVAGVLWFRSRQGDPASHALASRGARRALVGLLWVVGLVVLVGVWIDPGAHPRLFVWWWTGALLFVLALLAVALWDLMVVRRRAARERWSLWERSRAGIRAELEKPRRPDDPAAS